MVTLISRRFSMVIDAWHGREEAKELIKEIAGTNMVLHYLLQ